MHNERASDSKLQVALGLLAANKWNEALVAFEQIRLLAGDPYKEGVILLNEARCLEYLGNFSEANQRLKAARNHLQQIKSIDQLESFSIFLEIAEIIFEFSEGKHYQGIEHARRFLLKYQNELMRPEFEDARHDLNLSIAYELVSAGKFAEGVNALEELLPQATDEDQPRIFLFLGIAHEQLGDLDKALENFKSVLQFPSVEDTVAQAHYRLGALYWRKGVVAWAKQHFLAAESLKHVLSDIPVSDLYTFLANVCGYLGEEEERDKYLELAKTH